MYPSPFTPLHLFFLSKQKIIAPECALPVGMVLSTNSLSHRSPPARAAVAHTVHSTIANALAIQIWKWFVVPLQLQLQRSGGTKMPIVRRGPSGVCARPCHTMNEPPARPYICDWAAIDALLSLQLVRCSESRAIKHIFIYEYYEYLCMHTVDGVHIRTGGWLAIAFVPSQKQKQQQKTEKKIYSKRYVRSGSGSAHKIVEILNNYTSFQKGIISTSAAFNESSWGS